MSSGIFILNNSGFVVIDQNFSNYMLVHEGVTNTEVVVNFPAQNSGVAIFVGHTPNNSQVALLSATNSSFVLRGTTSQIASQSLLTFSISFRVYALISANTPHSSFGLNVNNAAGVRTFSSDARYPLVNQVTHYTAPSTARITLTIPSGSPFVSIGETLALSAAISPFDTPMGFVLQPAYDIKSSAVVVGSSITDISYPGGWGEENYRHNSCNLVSLRM